MLRSGALGLVTLAFIVSCGSANDDGLFAPPNTTPLRGGAPPAGGSASSTGGRAPPASGGTSSTGGITQAGGVSETGGEPPMTGGQGGSDGTGGGATGGTEPVGQGGNPEEGTPDSVSCSGNPCRSDTMPANTCCIGRPGVVQTFCRPEAPFPCSLYGASAFYCDDAADCGGGQRCCGTITGGLPSATCADECNGEGSNVQLCRTNVECANDRTCKPWEKFPEYDSCQ